MKRLGVLLAAVLLLGLLPGPARAAEVPAKSAFLMEVATGTVLYAQNEHAKLPPASVTKVMTLLLIRLDRKVQIALVRVKRVA